MIAVLLEYNLLVNLATRISLFIIAYIIILGHDPLAPLENMTMCITIKFFWNTSTGF